MLQRLIIILRKVHTYGLDVTRLGILCVQFKLLYRWEIDYLILLDYV